MGVDDYAKYEESFEATTSDGSRTCVGSRRSIFVAGKRRIRGNRRTGSGDTVFAVAGRGLASNHSQ
jgi:hypothetical protein